MDNRTDIIEDLQSTPQHPELQVEMGTAAVPGQEPTSSAELQGDAGLTSEQHNDAPHSADIGDTSRAPPSMQGVSMWQSLQQSVSRHPVQFALSAAGLGLLAVLLTRSRARSR